MPLPPARQKCRRLLISGSKRLEPARAIAGPWRDFYMTRKIASIILVLAISIVASGAPPAPIPRRSPDLVITEPSGKQVMLSSFKGKVVALEFFFLRSAKCLNLVNTMNKLNAELGPRGF